MDSKESIEHYKRMLEQYPNSELARFSLGKAYFDAGEIEPAHSSVAPGKRREERWVSIDKNSQKLNCGQKLVNTKVGGESPSLNSPNWAFP